MCFVIHHVGWLMNYHPRFIKKKELLLLMHATIWRTKMLSYVGKQGIFFPNIRTTWMQNNASTSNRFLSRKLLWFRSAYCFWSIRILVSSVWWPKNMNSIYDPTLNNKRIRLICTMEGFDFHFVKQNFTNRKRNFFSKFSISKEKLFYQWNFRSFLIKKREFNVKKYEIS